MRFDRHRLVHLDPTCWLAVLAAHPTTEPVVHDWVASGRPLIARRSMCSDGGGLVPLGLPLPPALGKQRLAFAVPADAIRSDEPPPLLTAAIAAAPPAWHPTIAALVKLDPQTRCFGSLAWAWLTGLNYLTDTSDLDLLWDVSDGEAAAHLAGALTEIAAAAPMTLDGEFVPPDGLAIQWREWASDAPDLLAKAADGNRMVPRTAVFA